MTPETEPLNFTLSPAHIIFVEMNPEETKGNPNIQKVWKTGNPHAKAISKYNAKSIPSLNKSFLDAPEEEGAASVSILG